MIKFLLIVLLAIVCLGVTGCGGEEESNTVRIEGKTGGVNTYSTQLRTLDGRIVTCIIARDEGTTGHGFGVGVGISCDWANANEP